MRMMLAKETLMQNKLFLDEWQRQDIIDILEEYYKRIDGVLQNMSVLSDNEDDFVDGHLLASYLLAIGDGYDFLLDKEHWLANVYNILVYFRQNIDKYYSLSLFHGLTDFAFGTFTVVVKSGEFCKFLESLNKLICNATQDKIKQIEAEETCVHHYDAIVGMAGVGRYLLLYLEHFQKNQNCFNEETALKQILKYFVKLAENIDVQDKEIIGFYVANKNLWPEKRRIEYPNGTLDFGIAHGMAGPLVIMAYAVAENITVRGLQAAIDNIIYVYKEHAEIDNDIICWPLIMPFELYKQPGAAIKGARMAWCYGSLGVSSVLYQVYKHLDLPIAEHLQNIEIIAKSSKEVFGLVSPIICHGFAGALTMLNQIYRETLIEELLPGLYMCLNEILHLHNSNFTYGFKNIDYGIEGRYEKEDDTYLNGSTGIILALLSLFNPNSLHEKHLLIS